MAASIDGKIISPTNNNHPTGIIEVKFKTKELDAVYTRVILTLASKANNVFYLHYIDSGLQLMSQILCTCSEEAGQ